MVTFTPQSVIDRRSRLGQALVGNALSPQANVSGLSPFAALAQGLAGGFLTGRAGAAERANADTRARTLDEAAQLAQQGADIGSVLLASPDPDQRAQGLALTLQERQRVSEGERRAAAEAESKRRFEAKMALERDKLAASRGKGSFEVDSFGRVFNKRTGEFVKPPAAATSASGVPPGVPRGAFLEKVLTPGEKAVDKAFAKDVVAFNAAGGFADTVKQLDQLEAVAKRLEGGEENLTGPVIGVTAGTTLGDIFFPTAAGVRESVEEVVQRNLRTVLGAQFTQKEGDRLISRAFNPRLSEAENARRVRNLVNQIRTAAQQKAAAVKHFQEFGSLRRFRGKLPTFADFDPAAGPPATTSARRPINRFRIIN